MSGGVQRRRDAQGRIVDASGRPLDVKRVVEDDKREAATLPISGWLLVLTGKHKGEDFRLREGKNTIGSDPSCEVVLTDSYISVKHAVIHVKRQTNTAGHYTVVDLDSTNHTYLNDSQEPIQREELVDNDVVSFGQTRCKIKCV